MTNAMQTSATSAPATAPDDLALGAHFRDCARCREPAFALFCVAEQVQQWIVSRVCTTALAAAALLTLLATWT